MTSSSASGPRPSSPRRSATAWKLSSVLTNLVQALKGDRVLVRRFRADEVDRVLMGRAQLDREALPEGASDREQLADRLGRSGTLLAGRIDLAIEADGRLVGEIQTYVPTDRPLPPATHELGVAIYDPRDRGRGFGTEAIRLLAGWLFGIGAERVQGAAAVGNAPMRRVFRNLGFEERGGLEVQAIPQVLYVFFKTGWEDAGPDVRVSTPL